MSIVRDEEISEQWEMREGKRKMKFEKFMGDEGKGSEVC
jgi:hypothetical protein